MAKRIPIAPGASLNVIETDKFKTNFISVNFIAPLSSDTASLNALFPAVLRRGTKSYPTTAKINERLEYLYGSGIGTRNYKRGEMQIVGFSAHVMDNSFTPDGTDILGGTLDLLCEMIFSPKITDGGFDKAYVESEKRSLTDAVKAKINNKAQYAYIRCQQEMCRGEAYGVQETGTVEDIEKITPDTLFSQYKKIISDARAEIFYVGRNASENAEKVADKMKTAFASVTRIESPIPLTEVIREAKEVREIVEDQPVAQGKLCMGFRTGTVLDDGDYHIFTVMNEIYGSGTSCKLFMNVRERLSLCYYCSSSPEPRKGVMFVSSGIEVEKKDVAQAEIIAQLNNIKEGIISDEEMDSAKKSLRNGYLGISDSAGGIESWYLGRRLAGLDDSPEEAAEKIESVTKEQVTEMAKKVTLDTVYFLRGTLLEKNEGGNE